MHKELKGKKLLILGATNSETTLVKRAQEMGVYVIVTDNHEDWTLAPAKYCADEAWNISWSDMDALEVRCRARGVDGVTAGYSEFRVENMIRLSKRLGLPCYITEEQLEITRDKVKFKNACRENGVPTVREYRSVEEVDAFPVIVKPVDRAGSIGISIAANREELEKAYQYAMDMSVVKKVIIEQYMRDTKVDVYYAVEDGKITLISSCDTIQAAGNGLEKVCQSCWLYPMAELRDYLRKVDAAAQKMIQSMGIRYGCIFFSGFVSPEGEFAFFECGFRLEGAHQYYYTERKGPFNFLDLFILHALTGSTENMARKPENTELKCAVVNFYAKAGVIGKITGAEEIARQEDCCLILVHGRPGERCQGERAILKKAAAVCFANEDPYALKQDVDEGYRTLQVLDENGADMVFDRIDTKKILSWWDNGDKE